MAKAKRGKSTRTSLPLPGDLYERLQAEHKRTGAPLAVIVRRAMDAYLTPREQIRRAMDAYLTPREQAARKGGTR